MKLEVINPFTGAVDRNYDYSSFEAAIQNIQKLKLSQAIWSQKTVSERIIKVKSCLKYFEDHRQVIAEDICRQMGRPRHQAAGEVSGMLERAQYMCSIAEKALSIDQVDSQSGFEKGIVHAPYGVVFTIAAWNYPLLVAVNSVVPALLAGNVVLLKHSGQTPEIGLHFQRAFSGELVQNIVLSHEVTGKIIESGSIDHVVFTGSVGGGRQILKHCAESLIAPGLELGGKDGVYVHEDADLALAVETAVDGAMFNSGQSCCGTERVYVHEKVYDEFIKKAKQLIQGYQLGDPMDEGTTMGPLFKSSAAEVMQEQVNEAVAKGAQLILGGEAVNIESGTFFQPTLIGQADHGMQVMLEENFGPIMPVMKVSGLNQAIECINDSKYGLTAAIFTEDKANAENFASQVQAGTVFMNRCDYLDPALPWTGYKQSGCGSSLSKYGFYSLSQPKSLHFKLKEES